MSDRNFRELLEARWAEGNFVCVGLDSEYDKIPLSVPRDIQGPFGTITRFNRAIVEATKDIVCAYKPNTAFYEAFGDSGMLALQRTIVDIRDIAPDVPVILDAKRGDIGNTNAGYAQMAFDYLGADAITVNPYLGAEALKPFLDRAEKGVIVLCRTSNPGAGEFQDLRVSITRREFDNMSLGQWLAPLFTTTATLPFYQYVAYRVAARSGEWSKNNNCALVVGATYPRELEEVRRIVGAMPILIPGVGTQGGDLEKTVKAGKDSRGRGMIINSSRGIIFASSGPDFADAARRATLALRDQINQYRWEGEEK